MSKTLAEHEKITDEMFSLFKRAVFTFISHIKTTHASTNSLFENQDIKKIANLEFENYSRDIKLFIDKVNSHYTGNVVEYELSEISLLSAIIYIFQKQEEMLSQISGYIFNNDAKYSFIFEDFSDLSDDNITKIKLFELLVRKFSKKPF